MNDLDNFVRLKDLILMLIEITFVVGLYGFTIILLFQKDENENKIFTIGRALKYSVTGAILLALLVGLIAVLVITSW